MAAPRSASSGSRRLARDLFVHPDDDGEGTELSARAALEEAAAAAEEAAARAAAEAAAAAQRAYEDEQAAFRSGAISKITTSMGVTVLSIEAGDRKTFAANGCYVRMHYEAFLHGTEEPAIDSSRARQQFFEFQQGSGYLLKGLEDALTLVSLRQLVHVIMPSEEAYGQEGFPPAVPGGATLRYEIKVLAIE
jgi:FK506-binding protein 1